MDEKDIIKQIDIIRIKDNKKIKLKDSIIDEDILKILINKTCAFEMVATMTHVTALAAGFIFTQNIVQQKTDILEINFIKEKRQCHITLNATATHRLETFKNSRQVKGSSGGALLQDPTDSTRPKDTLSITYDQVLSLIQSHWDHSELFHKTGAVHSAGVCTADGILSYYEDIGRHNALDKLAGDILLKGMDTRDKIATVSCRMSLEIIGKIIRTGIPIVISNAAPTLCAVKLADRAGLTIVGFARGNRFNIYTHEKRIRDNNSPL
ncbi:MAG: formate dehydrogenase accessory sulfurtransferase FdhD [Proteobacteria bacterium]|nr:formate dehydrogenase accessory sulfurtransferase FdhD [Pseudomonadota bacterium]MBU1582659.1 formate dehydrogenase accessory sulfurtransferase FdhD [Pseudomonadota bacterium]MBU2451759.1 formate dehydrogenase accessory sulfurtransferase FdhD [Pseudomonadota bacterium]MBU2630429.1 formate dehydrogenase accessory sulfurtransferase FdhD [Pseudomonadota bacterium]